MISIVDDDISVRRALSRLFKSAGYEVEAFDSCESFLQGGALDNTQCLILDVQLPQMSGLELQQRLLANQTSCPIVFISAFDDHDARDSALRDGAIGFFGKPVDVDLLLSLIEQAIH